VRYLWGLKPFELPRQNRAMLKKPTFLQGPEAAALVFVPLEDGDARSVGPSSSTQPGRCEEREAPCISDQAGSITVSAQLQSL
jgi:hypothetical protein